RDQALASPLGDGGRFREALGEAGKADELARAGGASDEVRQQAADLVADLDAEVRAAERDRRLLTALLDVRGPRARATFVRDEQGLIIAPVELSADQKFTLAFNEWGLDVDAPPTVEAAARLKARPAAVVTEVIAALDEWADERRGAGRQRLADLAAAL